MARRRVVPELVRAGRQVWARIFGRSVPEEVDEELSFHVEMRVRELLGRGFTLEEARVEAEERFGDLDAVKAACRRLARERERRATMRMGWDGLRQDVTFALRQLARNPGFSGVVILTLGLALGANGAVFSAVHGVLLRPLPYERPDELVSVWTRFLPSSGLDIPIFPLSPPEMFDLRAQSEAVEAVVPYLRATRTVAVDDEPPTRVGVTFLGRGMLELLGVEPAVGRPFAPEEEVGDPSVALLSHAFWQRRFGGDPGAVGRRLTVDGRSIRITGVMPDGFVFPAADAELWMPLGLDEADPPGRGSHYLAAVARLSPGVEMEAASAELERLNAAWSEEHRHHAIGHHLFLTPFKEGIVGETASVLWLLLAAVGLVLLVACVNVANLLLARLERRGREVAVRRALGAGRGRLLRQLLTESAVLALLAGLVGVLVARGAVAALRTLDPSALPRMQEVGIDGPVLLFSALLVLGTTVLFSLAPLLHVHGAAGALGEGRRATGRGRRLRNVLVTTEAAVAMVVVVAASLVTRSLVELTRVDPGIRTEEAFAFQLTLPAASYDSGEEIRSFYDGLVEQVGALPGVSEVSAANQVPLGGFGGWNDFVIEGRPVPADAEAPPNAAVVVARPGYLETLGVPVLRGRGFRTSDGPEGPWVALVNQAAVDRYWPGGDPVGTRIGYDYTGETGRPWLTVVGVVGNTSVESLEEGPRPQVFLPQAQAAAAWGETPRSMWVVGRSAQPVASLEAGLRSAVADLDGGLAVDRLASLDGMVASSVARPRLTATLLGSFAALALLLAVVGIYGVVAGSVAGRTREIGVRRALGARRLSVIRLMTRDGALPAFLGIALGLLAGWGGAGFLEGLLYGVRPTDPATFLLAPLGLGIVVLLACWIPAARAARVPPREALRE